MHAKRPLTLLVGASVSASAGLLYMGDGVAPPSPPTAPLASPAPPTSLCTGSHARPARELGLEQSLARDVACWISSASVYAARRAFDASAASPLPPPLRLSDPPSPVHASSVYHQLFGWLQELSPTAQHWDAQQVLQSSSFAMLLNAVSASSDSSSSAQPALERELFRAVGALATDAQCAQAIAERATRYGKRALLHLAQRHDDDARVGAALRRLVVLDDAAGVRFGPAHLVSLLSLAAAGTRAPDEYLEFALWALRKAASPRERQTRVYEWRKTLFGDDAAAKTKRKLVGNDALWRAVFDAADERSESVQLQAARLLSELSDDPAAASALQQYDPAAHVLTRWMSSRHVPLACAALEVVANVGQQNEHVRAALLATGALDTLRTRLLTNRDCRLTAKLLRAVRCLAEPLTGDRDSFVLDRDALSFLNDADDDLLYPLHHDDVVAPHAALARPQYVDGWIELFTTLMRADDPHVRAEAARCLEQLASRGSYTGQSRQEWLIAVLDAALLQVSPETTRVSTSVRAAKSRTRPLAGHVVSSSVDAFESAHARALRALAFVLHRPECQHELVRLGGVALLQLLLSSDHLLVQRETARALANVFSSPELHAGLRDFALSDEQLTTALAKWSHADDLQLQSLASRATANRQFQCDAARDARAAKKQKLRVATDVTMTTTANGSDSDGVRYLDGVHPLHLSASTRDDAFNRIDNNNTGATQTRGDYDVDVVFIHGLLGCAYETWMCGDDERAVWAHAWLLADLERAGRRPRVLSVGYDSQLLSSESAWHTLNFASTSDEIAHKLAAARVGASGRPIVFVTHSLGGVLLKQMLHDSVDQSHRPSAGASLVDSVRGVVFYGVPHHGSPVAQAVRALQPQRLGIEQHPVTEHLHGTAHSEMLNDWCADLFEERGIAALSIGETLPCRLPVVGLETVVVPSASANPGFGDFVSVPGATHMSVCKPTSPQDVRYTLARDFVARHSMPKGGNDNDELVALDVE